MQGRLGQAMHAEHTAVALCLDRVVQFVEIGIEDLLELPVCPQQLLQVITLDA